MIYAIGDVHGEADVLREMLALLPVQASDLVVFLGDIIDRGLFSFDCVEQVLHFNRCPKVFIHGNHEDAMRGFLEDGDMMAMVGMNGQSTLDDYESHGYVLASGGIQNLPPAHAQFFAQGFPWTLPFYITNEYIFTHAGWNLSLPLARQSVEAMRWGGIKGQEAPVWPQTVVRGHLPFPKVMFARKKQYIGVDTGCGAGGFLSAVRLPDEKVFTVRPASFRPDWYTNRRG